MAGEDRAVNPPCYQILSIDREEMIDDVILHRQIKSFMQKKFVDSNQCIEHINSSHLATLLVKLQWHTTIYRETFHVNSSSQTIQNIWNFVVGKSSLQEIATLKIIREISDSNLGTRRYGPKSGVSRIIWASWQHWEEDQRSSSLL